MEKPPPSMNELTPTVRTENVEGSTTFQPPSREAFKDCLGASG